MRSSPLTVVIPARNEEHNLCQCLQALEQQDHRGRLRIVVVANGCNDRSGEITREFSERLTCDRELILRELPAASKPDALNEGDRFALAGHRIYLDADAVLSPNALRLMGAALDCNSGVHLCAPRRVLRRPRSRLAISYSRVWSALPYVENSIVFCGVYAVSEAGRARWGDFPPIQSDDKFVRLQFEHDQQLCLQEATSTITLPDDSRSLIRSRIRWCRGNGDLRRRYPDLEARDRGRYRGILTRILQRPDLWIDVPLYAATHLAAFVWSRLDPREGEYQWNR